MEKFAFLIEGKLFTKFCNTIYSILSSINIFEGFFYFSNKSSKILFSIKLVLNT